MLWRHFFNVAIRCIGKPDWDRRIARYTSINLLLTSYQEKDETRVKHARRRVALNVCVGIIGAVMALDISRNKDIYLRKTGSLYPLTGRECPAQAGHIDLEVRESRNPSCFVPVFRSESICLILCHARKTYVHCQIDSKKKSTRLPRLEGVAISTYSVFDVHGYLQHGGCVWQGSGSDFEQRETCCS